MANLKTAICCIAKNENRYIEEFIDYHLQLGFSSIYIFDNNDLDGERIADSVPENLLNKRVFIITIHGFKVTQLPAYEFFYKTHFIDFDWIAFIDIDEFIFLNHHRYIYEYLKNPKFKDFDIIRLNTIVYDDNGLLHYDDRPVMKRFTNAVIDNPKSRLTKSIIKGGNPAFLWSVFLPHNTSHLPLLKSSKCCDNEGNLVNNNSPFLDVNIKDAFIKHFWSKSMDEFLLKRLRGYPDQKTLFIDMKKNIDDYFEVNKKTPEKAEYAKKVLKFLNE